MAASRNRALCLLLQGRRRPESSRQPSRTPTKKSQTSVFGALCTCSHTAYACDTEAETGMLATDRRRRPGNKLSLSSAGGSSCPFSSGTAWAAGDGAA
ncbi:hypothetical protein AAFF_G00352480 [Aldrovandia affinis]|uniref:Uncharacterized protein n=1 Tax=Aldrovandia affinis TaxID=143900 RepID=A0AAD7SL61_9TELE|nr:hypothetical protein AAFF_G00352480 [Aldrovandia affinis]